MLNKKVFTGILICVSFVCLISCKFEDPLRYNNGPILMEPVIDKTEAGVGEEITFCQKLDYHFIYKYDLYIALKGIPDTYEVIDGEEVEGGVEGWKFFKMKYESDTIGFVTLKFSFNEAGTKTIDLNYADSLTNLVLNSDNASVKPEILIKD